MYGMGMVIRAQFQHFGPAGHWAIKLAGTDMIGFATTNGPPLVAAHAAEKLSLGISIFQWPCLETIIPTCGGHLHGMMALARYTSTGGLLNHSPKLLA
jgi:hypothetical protein